MGNDLGSFYEKIGFPSRTRIELSAWLLTPASSAKQGEAA